MDKDLALAKQLLTTEEHTCVLCRDDRIYTSTRRGVAPLLGWLDSDLDLRGFSAADRVIGKATAYLYCLLGVKEVFARVISRPATQVLENHGIPAHWDTLVEGIQNRQKTGPCPMEAATADSHTPEEALTAIRKKLQQLRNN